MKRLKKISSFLCAFVLAVSSFSMTAYAENIEIEAGQVREISMQSLTAGETEALSLQELDNITNVPQSQHLLSLEGVSDSPLNTREIWAINDPVFVGDGTLTDVCDIYVVTLTADQLACLKLNSSNSNLMAVLYTIENGSLGSSTGWGVYANAEAGYIGVPAKQYAIVVGSATGTETGDYTLMWNCANSATGAKYVINSTSDLSRVVVFYTKDMIQSNGTNILEDLTWEDHETWYTSLGYSARDMSMTWFGSKGVYLGSFSSSAPYSAPNALLIDISRGSWSYSNSYYTNKEGEVTHVIDRYDLSGMQTPRTFGEGPYDFSYGPNYIVINLDTFQVCEFLSPFNYHYSKEGGRTFTLTNLQQLG